MVRRGRKRMGQAQNAVLNAQPQNGVLDGASFNTSDPDNNTYLDEYRASADGPIYRSNPDGPTGVQTYASVENNPDGSTDNTYLMQFPEGGEAMVRYPQQEAEPQPDPAEECEFRAQSVELQRDVIITSTTPRIVDSESDVCGNLLSFKESMTRTMTAGDWVPTNGTGGPFNVAVEDNGEVYVRGNTGADIANSSGLADMTNPNQVTSQTSLGSRYPAAAFNGNNVVGARRGRNTATRSFGAASMKRFRSA